MFLGAIKLVSKEYQNNMRGNVLFQFDLVVFQIVTASSDLTSSKHSLPTSAVSLVLSITRVGSNFPIKSFLPISS